jgi:hypothetical protein
MISARKPGQARPRKDRSSNRALQGGRDRLDDFTTGRSDVPPGQGFLRASAEARLEHREDLRTRLNEDDLRLLLGNARVVLHEDRAVELSDGASQLAGNWNRRMRPRPGRYP